MFVLMAQFGYRYFLYTFGTIIINIITVLIITNITTMFIISTFIIATLITNIITIFIITMFINATILLILLLYI